MFEGPTAAQCQYVVSVRHAPHRRIFIPTPVQVFRALQGNVSPAGGIKMFPGLSYQHHLNQESLPLCLESQGWGLSEWTEPLAVHYEDLTR